MIIGKFWLFFASSAGLGGDGGAGAGAPPAGGDGGGSGSGGDGGAPAGSGGSSSGAGAGSGGAPVVSPNIAQLRQQYEALKARHDPYEKLGDIDSLQTAHTGWSNLYSQASELGTQLGYPEDEIAEALRESPVETLDYLRRQASAQGGGEKDEAGQLQDRIQEMIDQGLKPVYEQQNVQKTEAANALFERTGHTILTDYFKKEGLDITKVDPEEVNAINMVAREVFKWNADGIKALKFEGKTVGVQKAYQEAMNFLDSFYAKRSMREQAKIIPPTRGGAPAPGRGQAAGNGHKTPSLDDMIDNPELINKKYKPGM